MSVILVIDTGSSSMRGMLFDHTGQLRYTVSEHYVMRTHGIEAEYLPEDFEHALLGITRNAASFAKSAGIRIDALSFTSQRSSTMPVDRLGRPLDTIMTWYDKRAAQICDDMNQTHGALLFETAGMQASPVLSAPKISWLRSNKPAVYDEAYKIIGIQDYLIFLCTGEFITDASLASRSNLMDVRTKTWSASLLSLWQIDRDKLCTLVPPMTQIGRITENFSVKTGLDIGTRVIAAGGDQQCSVLGQGLFNPGNAGVTCGSGSYVAAVCDSPVIDPQHRININAAIVPDQWILEASTLSSGTVQDWMLRNFFSEQNDALGCLQKEASQSPAGANGLVMLPDLAGKGAPDWDNYAKGVFWNVTLSTTRGDFARAMLEGLCGEITECHAALHSLDGRIGDVRITGGLSRFDLFCQILSDMTGGCVTRCSNDETTAVGAYMAAAVALGDCKDLEEAYSLAVKKSAGAVFTPDRNLHLMYQTANKRRRLLYESIPAQAILEIE